MINTVQELIDELSKIEDKTLQPKIFCQIDAVDVFLKEIKIEDIPNEDEEKPMTKVLLLVEEE